MRPFVLVLVAWLLAAAAPPLPEALKPYVHDGRFDPGDYGWMRGRFEGATPAERAVHDSIQAWVGKCIEDGMAETRAELRAMGISEPKLEQIGLRDPLCSQVAFAPYPITARFFAVFQHAIAAGAPLAETYLVAVRTAEHFGGSRTPELRDLIMARPLGEQMLRQALSWGEGDMSDVPRLAPDARAVMLSRLSMALTMEDHDNTRWLKGIVEKQGWPKISDVGAAAAKEAWLLVQHADADPAFQLKVLRLMEPMVPTGEISKGDFAYLYDRVMLKIAGRQRYATQMTCANGQRIPQPLEDARQVDRLRADVGLGPVASYVKQMDQSFGECPSSPAK